MALTHITDLRNEHANSTVDRLDLGSADAQGDLVIYDSGFSTILAIFPLANPAAGAASGGTATFTDPADITGTASGNAAGFIMRDRDNNEVYRGTVTVTGGGGDITLSRIDIVISEPLSVTSSITYSASQ